MLDGLDEKPTVFEQEYFPEMALAVSDEPYTVTYDELEQEYVVEGPRIEKCLAIPTSNPKRDLRSSRDF